jgi:hypothetical protein
MRPTRDHVQGIAAPAMVDMRFNSRAMYRLGDADTGADRHCAAAFSESHEGLPMSNVRQPILEVMAKQLSVLLADGCRNAVWQEVLDGHICRTGPYLLHRSLIVQKLDVSAILGGKQLTCSIQRLSAAQLFQLADKIGRHVRPETKKRPLRRSHQMKSGCRSAVPLIRADNSSIDVRTIKCIDAFSEKFRPSFGTSWHTQPGP